MSLASEPELAKKTRAIGTCVDAFSRSARRPMGSVVLSISEW